MSLYHFERGVLHTLLAMLSSLRTDHLMRIYQGAFLQRKISKFNKVSKTKFNFLDSESNSFFLFLIEQSERILCLERSWRIMSTYSSHHIFEYLSCEVFFRNHFYRDPLHPNPLFFDRTVHIGIKFYLFMNCFLKNGFQILFFIVNQIT